MTLTTNNAEGGFNGTAVAVGQAMSGTPFSTVTGSAVVYSSAQAAHGALSYRLSNASTAAIAVVLPLPSGATKYAARMYVRFATLPPAFTYLIAPASSSGAKFRVDTGNKFAIADADGTIVATFPTAFTTGVWYRLELELDSGTVGTTTGTLAGRYFLGDATTPVDTAYSSSAVKTAGGSFTGVQFGASTVSPASAIDMYLDDLAFNDGTTTPIGPATAGPTARSSAGVAKSYPSSPSRAASITRAYLPPTVYSRSAATSRFYLYPGIARTVAGATRTWAGTVPSIPAPVVLTTGQLWPRGKR